MWFTYTTLPSTFFASQPGGHARVHGDMEYIQRDCKRRVGWRVSVRATERADVIYAPAAASDVSDGWGRVKRSFPTLYIACSRRCGDKTLMYMTKKHQNPPVRVLRRQDAPHLLCVLIYLYSCEPFGPLTFREARPRFLLEHRSLPPLTAGNLYLVAMKTAKRFPRRI